MNKKGMAIGGFILMAVMVILVIALLPQIFGNEKILTQTYYVRNVTVTLGNNGTWTDLPYQEYEGTLLFQNATVTATPVSAANFSVREGVGTNNVKRVQISPCGASTCGWNSSTINVSGTFALEGYADDAGARGVAQLMGLLSVLALFAGVIYYWYKEGGLELLVG